LLVPPWWHLIEAELESVLTGVLPDIIGKAQFFFTPGAISRAVAYMSWQGDVEGRNIVCLTAPTVGIALGLLRRRAQLSRTNIAVLDIDPDLLRLIEGLRLGVRTVRYDFQDACPAELEGRFDVFFIDPLYAEDHYRLVLSRCVDLIGARLPGKVGYIVIPPPEIAPIRSPDLGRPVPLQLSIRRWLDAMGFYLAEIKPGFLRYDTPPAELAILRHRQLIPPGDDAWRNWWAVDLACVVSTAETHPLAADDERLTTRVNGQGRLSFNPRYVPLAEIGDEHAFCHLCARCLSSEIAAQKVADCHIYVTPQIEVRPLYSWRDEGHQPFEVAPSCLAFADLQDGQLVVLKGPTARAIWQTVVGTSGSSAESAVEREDLLRRSSLALEDLDHRAAQREVSQFLSQLRTLGLVPAKVNGSEGQLLITIRHHRS